MQIRKHLAAALTTVAATVAATVAGNAGAAPSTIEAATPLVSVQTIAAAAHRMPPADAASLAGLYDLANGETLRVSYERNRLYAAMGERKSELVPAASAGI
jgi:hypothetical protein